MVLYFLFVWFLECIDMFSKFIVKLILVEKFIKNFFVVIELIYLDKIIEYLNIKFD